MYNKYFTLCFCLFILFLFLFLQFQAVQYRTACLVLAICLRYITMVLCEPTTPPKSVRLTNDPVVQPLLLCYWAEKNCSLPTFVCDELVSRGIQPASHCDSWGQQFGQYSKHLVLAGKGTYPVRDIQRVQIRFFFPPLSRSDGTAKCTGL